MKALDLIGQKFGKLTVVERVENSKEGRSRWKCRCDCGNECIVIGKCLTRGTTHSCGCFKSQRNSEAHLKDLTGKKFGRLTVISRAADKNGDVCWNCHCDCGNDCIVIGYLLTSGGTKSCGCLRREISAKHRTTHGLSKEKAYGVWCGIKDRCFNPNCPAYKDYGGRGITMYEAWVNDFQAFYDYVSKLPHFGEKGYTLDRIDNIKGYEPDNLRWATAKQQARNKRNNRIVEYEGAKMPLAEAAEKSGINLYTLKNRLKTGDTGERLFRPVKKHKHN